MEKLAKCLQANTLQCHHAQNIKSMGGSIAISIKISDKQQNIIQKHVNVKHPKYIVPKCINFISWTNWITWIMHSSDLWLQSSENAELQARIEDQTTLKEIIDNVLKDSIDSKVYGLQKLPNPYGYGIILYDLESGNVLSSQGYSSPGHLYLSDHSSACKEQYEMLRLATHGGLINYILLDSFFTNTKPEATRKELIAKGLNFAYASSGKREIVNIADLKYTGCSKKDFDFTNATILPGHIFIPSGEFAKVCDQVIKEGNEAEANRRKHRKLGTKSSIAGILAGFKKLQAPYGLFSSIQVIYRKAGNPLSITCIAEPCDKSEVYDRLEAINTYLLENKWKDQLDIPKCIPDPEVESADIETLFHKIELNQDGSPKK